MVKNVALVTIPNRDSPENGGAQGPYAYGVVWMNGILSSLLLKGERRQVLQGDSDVGDKFEDAARATDPCLIIGFGHGASDIWVGQYVPTEERYSTLLTPANADLMAGRAVYLLSCLTAQELGPALVNSGAISYAGYNQEFTWVGSETSSPATDLHAAPFGTAATAYPKELIAGKTVAEARDRAIAVFNEEIAKWEQSDDSYAREIVKWLLWDRDAFIVLGDDTTTAIIPRIPVILIVGGAIVAGAVAYAIYRRRKRR
jgi:hypothetical protein